MQIYIVVHKTKTGNTALSQDNFCRNTTSIVQSTYRQLTFTNLRLPQIK